MRVNCLNTLEAKSLGMSPKCFFKGEQANSIGVKKIQNLTEEIFRWYNKNQQIISEYGRDKSDSFNGSP